MKKVDSAFSNSFQWLEQTRQKSANTPKHLPPSVTVAQIRQQKSDFESIVGAVLNKPPPKAPSPPKEQKPPAPEEAKNTESNNAQQQEGSGQQENMEWQSN